VTLAIDGGPPVRSRPWPSWPAFSHAEIDLVAGVLTSGAVNYWTGDYGRRFEAAYASYLGVSDAIAVMNGTVALELALRALGVGPGDEVIVPCRTFIASASCVVTIGATPVLCDVDPATHTLSAETVTAVMTSRTRAVVAVHLAGMPCDMDPLGELCAEHGVFLVEDCAQAHGARYRDRPVGCLGDAAAFSFCQDKIITTGGEGGLVVVPPEAVTKARQYKDHGRRAEGAAGGSGLSYRCVYDSFGTNLRMTEMQAALGLHQLEHLDSTVASRRETARLLDSGLSDVDGLARPDVPHWAYHAYYRYYALLDLDRLSPGWDRERILVALAAEGVPVSTGVCPDLGAEAAFDGVAGAGDPRPHAHEIGRRSLMFHVHPLVTAEDIADYVTAVRKVFAEAVRA
jgi:dTDP-4-amino-4,6-dideoxygalactose transaminase